MKTETCKRYFRDFWIFLPNTIKIDRYNFKLYYTVSKLGRFLRHSVHINSRNSLCWIACLMVKVWSDLRWFRSWYSTSNTFTRRKLWQFRGWRNDRWDSCAAPVSTWSSRRGDRTARTPCRLVGPCIHDTHVGPWDVDSQPTDRHLNAAQQCRLSTSWYLSLTNGIQIREYRSLTVNVLFRGSSGENCARVFCRNGSLAGVWSKLQLSVKADLRSVVWNQC